MSATVRMLRHLVVGSLVLAATLLAADGMAPVPTSADEDTTPPELVAFDFEPKVVDTSTSSHTITFTAHLTDSPAGLAGDGYTSSPTQVRFRSPSGSQFVTAVFSGDGNRVSGTRQDGVFEDEVTLPQFSEQGTWLIEHFLLVDQVGNMTWLSATDVAALGFPTTFEVGPAVAANQLEAVSLGPEVILFGRSPANDLWFRETDSGVFGPWTTFDTASSVAGDPKGLRRGNNDVYVFFRGPSGDLRYAMGDGITTAWSFDSLGGQVLGDPVVATDADGDLVVVVAGTGGGLWYRRLPAGSDVFEDWAGMDGVFPEANMTLATLDGDLHLIGLDSDYGAWARVWDGTTNAWGGWDYLGGYITSAELTLVSHDGELHFLVLGGDGALFSRTYSGGWGVWTALDGQLEGTVAAVSSGGAVLLAGVNRAGGSWSRTSADGATWSGWEFMEGLVATTPEMVATDNGAYYFAQSANGGVWYREWAGAAWGAWASLGGAIASE